MPEELRNLGDLYVKQELLEFRLHLDTGNDEQMDKFMFEWKKYHVQLGLLGGMDMSTKRAVKASIMDPKFDEMVKDKLSEE